MSGAGYHALRAKVRALYGKRLRQGDLEHMNSLRSVEEVMEFLRSHPSWQRSLQSLDPLHIDRSTLETALQDELREEFVSLNHYVPRTDKRVLAFPVQLTELHTILAAMRRLNSQGHLLTELQPSSRFLLHSRLDYAALSQASDYGGIVDAVRDSIYYDAMSHLAPESGGALPDYTVVESLLRSTYYINMFRTINKLSDAEDRKILRKCFGIEVDMLNAIHILRMKAYFPDDNRYLTALFPFNYKLRPDLIAALCAAPDVDAVFALLDGTVYARFFQNRSLTHLDQLYHEAFARFNRRLIHSGAPSIYLAVAYLNFKETELRAVINVIESVKYGVPCDPAYGRCLGA